MKFSKLRKLSRNDFNRQKLVAKGLLQHDLWSYLRYLIYRIKLPFFFKFSSRLILIFEIALIYQTFSYNILGDLTFYLFIIIVSRGILRGINQHYRPRLSKSLNNKNYNLFNSELNRALIVNLFCSACLAIFVSYICLQLGFSEDFNLFFIISWCLLIPMDQITGLLWGAVYLRQRLPRKVWLTLLCRIFPILAIITLGNLIGPYSYLFGIFIGRLAEKSYLIYLAVGTLNFKLKRKLSYRNISRIILQYLGNKKARKYFYFSAAVPLYTLGLGLIIFSYNSDYWLINMIYYFALNFIVYLTTQMSRSVGFDIYSCLKKGRLFQAKFLGRRIFKIATINSIFLTALILILAINTPIVSTLISQNLDQYLLILLVSIIVHTTLQTLLNQFQATAIDSAHYKLLILPLIFLALPVQYFLLTYFVVNLQTIYWVEVIVFLICTVLMKKNLSFQLSPFYLNFIKKERRSLPFTSPASLQLQARCQFHNRGKANLYLVAFLEKDLRLDKIKHFLPNTKNLLIAPYTAGVYLISSSSSLQQQDFTNLSTIGFMNISLELPISELLDNIYNFMNNLKFLSKKFKLIQNKFELDSKQIIDLESIVSANGKFQDIISELLVAPSIEIKKDQIIKRNISILQSFNSSYKALLEYSLNKTFKNRKYTLPSLKGSLVALNIAPNHSYYYDLRGLNSYQISLIHKKLNYLNQASFFQTIKASESISMHGLGDYLAARRMIRFDCRLSKIKSAAAVVRFDYLNYSLIK